MPLIIRVSVSRKIGQPEFSSVGASCEIQAELDAGALHDLDGFHDECRRVYCAAHQAVNDELARLQVWPPMYSDAQSVAANGTDHASNGRPTRTWDAPTQPGGAPTRSPRAATAGQTRAIYALTRQAGVDLANLLHDHGVARVEDLSIKAASAIIDRLKVEAGA